MSGLQQFDYGNWSVRTFVAADGQPWFVAADVCAALGFANRGQALATHVDPVDRGSILWIPPAARRTPS